MIRYTTPTDAFSIAGKDITATDVYVTYEQDGNVLTLRPETLEYDGEKTSLTVSLTQLQTASFDVGWCDVQVNWVVDGVRNATCVKRIPVGTNLLEEEL